MKPVIFCLILLLGLVGVPFASRAETQISPNKKYKAISDDDRHSVMVFAVASNRLIAKIGVFGVLKMEWSKNSKLLILHDHLAGGSEVKVLSLKDEQGTQTVYDPESFLEGNSNRGTYYGVIAVKDAGNQLHIKYLVSQRQRDTSIAYKLIEFDVTPPSEKIVNVKEQQISEEEGEKIITVGQ